MFKNAAADKGHTLDNHSIHCKALISFGVRYFLRRARGRIAAIAADRERHTSSGTYQITA